MLSCKEVSRLYSESLEHDLSWRQRVSLWMHLRMCVLCKGFTEHLSLFRDASRRYADQVEHGDDSIVMPVETRKRIEARLKSSGN